MIESKTIIDMEDLLVKQYTKYTYDCCLVTKANSNQFVNRIQAYYSLLVA